MALRTWNQTAIIKYLQTGSIRRGSNRSARKPTYHQSKQQWPSSRYRNPNESEESIQDIVRYSEYGGIHKELYPKTVKHILSRAEEIENLAKKARQYFERQNKSKVKYVWDREKRVKKDRPSNTSFSEINLIKYYKDNYTNEILQPSKQPSFGSLDLRSIREIPKSHKIAIVSPNTKISSLNNTGIVKREMSSNPPDLSKIKVTNSKSKVIKFDTKKTSLANVKISDENNECNPGTSEENSISCDKLLNSNDDVVASEDNNYAKDEEQTKDMLPAVDHGTPSFNAFIWEDITGMLRPRSASTPKPEYVPMQDEVKKVDVAVDEEISKMQAKREARIKAVQVEQKKTRKKSPVVKTKPEKIKVPKPSKKITRGFIVKEKANHSRNPISKPTPKTLTVDDLNKQINRLKKNECLLDKLIKKTASSGKIVKKTKRTTTKENVEPKPSGPDLSLFNKIRSTSNVPNQKPKTAPKQIHFTVDIPQSVTAIVYKKRKYSTFSANVIRLLKNCDKTADLPKSMSQRTNKSHFDGICESPETEYQEHSDPCDCVEPFRPSILPKMHRLVKRYNTNMGNEEVPKECLPPCATSERADDNVDLYKKKCLPNIKDADCPCIEPSEYTRKVKLCRLTKCIPCPNQQLTCPDVCPKYIEKSEIYIPKKCLPKLTDPPCPCVEPKRLSVMPKLCRLVKRCDDGPVAISPKCEKVCKIERADDKVDLYKKKCLPEIEDSGCEKFCEKPLKDVRLCRLIKKNVLASVGEIKDEKCESECVLPNVYVAKKKLPKLTPSNCECVERPAATMPKLCRLVKKKDYPSHPSKECIPVCSIVSRADDGLDLYKKKCLPEIRDSDCLCIEPSMKDVKMCRLEKKQALSLSECKTTPCTIPRADNLALYEVEKRKLPNFPCSPCLCVEPDIPKILPKIPKLIKRPLKPTDLPIVPVCKVSCPTPRADDEVNLYTKKCLPEYAESSCECIEPLRLKSVPLCKPKMTSKTAGLALVEEICEKPCEETADDVCKYEIKKKRLKPILPRRKPHNKCSSRGFQCFKPNNSKKRYYSSQPSKLVRIVSDSDDEAEQEELVLKILRLIKLRSRKTYENANPLFDVKGAGLTKNLSAITYDGKFKLIPSEKVPCSLRLENNVTRPTDLANENSRPGGLYYEEYEALENTKTKNMQEILDDMLKRSKGSK